jgi:hypothetical protein
MRYLIYLSTHRQLHILYSVPSNVNTMHDELSGMCKAAVMDAFKEGRRIPFFTNSD